MVFCAKVDGHHSIKTTIRLKVDSLKGEKLMVSLLDRPIPSWKTFHFFTLFDCPYFINTIVQFSPLRPSTYLFDYKTTNLIDFCWFHNFQTTPSRPTTRNTDHTEHGFHTNNLNTSRSRSMRSMDKLHKWTFLFIKLPFFNFSKFWSALRLEDIQGQPTQYRCQKLAHTIKCLFIFPASSTLICFQLSVL